MIQLLQEPSTKVSCSPISSHSLMGCSNFCWMAVGCARAKEWCLRTLDSLTAAVHDFFNT